jgi:hypothetical protein
MIDIYNRFKNCEVDNDGPKFHNGKQLLPIYWLINIDASYQNINEALKKHKENVIKIVFMKELIQLHFTKKVVYILKITCDELYELYNNFKDMQHEIIKYIKNNVNQLIHSNNDAINRWTLSIILGRHYV